MASVVAKVASVANPVVEVVPWHRRLTALVGQRVKSAREGKMTVRELADRCEQLGHRIEPQVIHNMEVGRRNNVTVAELLVLAAALETPQVLLLTPLGSDEPAELLPDRDSDPWTAYQWLLGELPTDELGQPPQLDSKWLPPVIAAYRRHHNGLRHYLRHPADDIALMTIASARTQMQEQGWQRPPLPNDVAEALRPVLYALGWREDNPGELVRVQSWDDQALTPEEIESEQTP